MDQVSVNHNGIIGDTQPLAWILAVLLPSFGSCENICFSLVMAFFPHGQLQWQIGAIEAKVNHNCHWCIIHTRSI